MNSPAEAAEEPNGDSTRWQALVARMQLAWYRYPLLWLLLPLLLGTQLGNWCGQNVSAVAAELLAWGSLLVAVGSIVASLKMSAKPIGDSPQLKGLSWTALLASVGIGVALALWQVPPEGDDLAPFAARQPEAIAVRGTLASVAQWRQNLSYRPDQPESEQWLTSWRIECSAVRHEQSWRSIHATSNLTVPGRIVDLLPGDRVQLYGSFRAVSEPTNPGAFDYAAQASRRGEFVRLSTDDRRQIQIIGLDPSYLLRRCRGLAVRTVDANLQRWIPYNQSALAAALVFGQRTQVDWDDRQELMATGTLHLLAISGLHVAIVAGAIFLLCRFFQLPTVVSTTAVIACCVLYAALAGGQPPVLRAVVLIGLVLLTRTWGRLGRLPNLLSAAAILLLFIDAHHVGEVGVHLSFLAVASLSIFARRDGTHSPRREAVATILDQQLPRLNRWLRRLGKGAWGGLQLSGWVWLMTCPLIWSTFHVVSPIAIPLNVLLSVPLMVSLLCGLLTGLLGSVAWLAAILGWISGACLAVISWMVSIGESVPLGHWWLPAPSYYWTAAFYSAVASWLLFVGNTHRRWLALGLGLWIIIGVAPHAWGPRGYLTPKGDATTTDRVREELRITFIDVGHGTSVMIEFPTGPVWLYDAGRLGAAETSHMDIASGLWHIPTARIDNLIISHADSDHYNAVHGLLQRFNVSRVTSTERLWNSAAGDVQKLHASIQRSGVPKHSWSAGAAGILGEVQWRVLHPRDSLGAESDNASSLCMLLEYADRRVFLPGDLEGTGMLDLLDMPPRPCHILMAPHHGSISHDPRIILDWCVPETVVISGNQRALRSEVLEKFRRVDTALAITFRDGAIQIAIDRAGKIERRRWCGKGWQTF